MMNILDYLSISWRTLKTKPFSTISDFSSLQNQLSCLFEGVSSISSLLFDMQRVDDNPPYVLLYTFKKNLIISFKNAIMSLSFLALFTCLLGGKTTCVWSSKGATPAMHMQTRIWKEGGGCVLYSSICVQWWQPFDERVAHMGDLKCSTCFPHASIFDVQHVAGNSSRLCDLLKTVLSKSMMAGCGLLLPHLRVYTCESVCHEVCSLVCVCTLFL